MKKILLNSVEEHWEWAWSYLRFKTGDDDIWSFHREKMEPFFRFDEKNRGKEWQQMPEDVKESFEYYKEHCGYDGKERKDIAGSIDLPELTDILGFVYDYDQEVDDDYCPLIKNKPWSPREDIRYPCVLSTWMEQDYDRFSGQNTIICNSFISLEDFKR